MPPRAYTDYDADQHGWHTASPERIAQFLAATYMIAPGAASAPRVPKRALRAALAAYLGHPPGRSEVWMLYAALARAGAAKTRSQGEDWYRLAAAPSTPRPQS